MRRFVVVVNKALQALAEKAVPSFVEAETRSSFDQLKIPGRNT